MKGTKSRRTLIAVVEDDPDYRDMLCSWLRPRYRTVDFDDAEQLLNAPRGRAEAELVITDVRMPGINGFRLCERLRADMRYHRVPVLFLTGIDANDGLMLGLQVGASAYLTKPVERESLLEQIEKLLDAQAL